LVAAGGPPPQDGPIKYSGGWNPWAFGLAFWEQLTGLALGLGIMSWFYRKGTTSHPIARWLSDRSFGVYMLHSPIMVALTPLCDSIANMSRLVAADVLTVATLIGSFIVADMTKRIPFLKRML
jgi:peptidoglycan/LPS O-acetylase OafA/YrhL